MDKNTIIGFLLIGVVLFGFMWLNRPSEKQLEAQRHYQDSIAHVAATAQQAAEKQLAEAAAPAMAQDSSAVSPDSLKSVFLQNTYGIFANAAEGDEEFTVLENEKVKITLSTKGGRVYSAKIKGYQTYNGQPLVLFDGEDADFNLSLITATNRVVNTSDLYFSLLKGADPNTAVMRLKVGESGHIDFNYTLPPNDYRVKYTISASGLNGLLAPTTRSLNLTWTQKMRQLEKGRKYEDQYTGLYYKPVGDEVEHLNETKNDGKELNNQVRWIGFKNKYFSSVLISDNGFTKTVLDSKLLETDTVYLKSFRTLASVPFNITEDNTLSFSYFFGPNKYKLLNSYDKGLSSEQRLDMEQLVPLGYKLFRPINKYFILPIFDFLGQHIANYGLVIFLLTLIVKFCLFPLTYKSYISSAKMRVLRPEVEEINAKYPGQEQALDRQKEIMDLYSRAGASPMAGCLPMLLQMPILIALYWLFPTAIELRQQGFLWAEDLSTFDAIVSWNTHIPLLSTFYGNHVSLFCLLMTIVNIAYTKYNMSLTDTGQQQMPGMKAMMYLMPLMFLFIFNQNSSGLSYYFLVSTLITIIQTMIFRFSINEEKLLAKLQENKKRPQKKSSFMKRLEEAQKLQGERLRQQQQQNRGKK